MVGRAAFLALETKRKAVRDHETRQQAQLLQIQQSSRELNEWQDRLRGQESKVISYKELLDENALLKRDLRNIALGMSKLQLDRDQQRQTQHAIDERSKALGARYLKDNVKWLGNSLTPSNFSHSKQRLLDVIGHCRSIGFEIGPAEEAGLLDDLKAEYARVVKAAFEREEQARIKAQIREEQLRDREAQRLIKQFEHEQEVIKAALDKALAEARGEYSALVEQLKAKLAEAERSKRAISQAQLTRLGHVYVISNIGSFGEGVFKIGMTRRLTPKERVDELGSASVPFPFDIHMMITANDAPALENTLHRQLSRLRINRANPRKEFFKTDIESIVRIVKEQHGEVEYVVDASALQYRQSLEMPEEDQQFIESVYDQLEDEEEDAFAAEIP